MAEEVRRSNPWLMDVLKSCLQRNPAKRPPISGVGGLLQHPFLQPQGERAMQLFQAAALGNENMQDVVREVLETAEDPVWNAEDSVKRVCYVGVEGGVNGRSCLFNARRRIVLV